MIWRAIKGVNWPDGAGEARAEPGSAVPDDVVRANEWLIEQGAVEAAASEPTPAPTPTEPEEPTDG